MDGGLIVDPYLSMFRLFSGGLLKGYCVEPSLLHFSPLCGVLVLLVCGGVEAMAGPPDRLV